MGHKITQHSSTIKIYEKWGQTVPFLFYSALVVIGLIWLQLGNTWYAKIVPFYDSLTYQDSTEAILREYQSNSWGNMVSILLSGVTAVLYKVVVTILAPVLPLTRTTLYVYLIPLHLIALATLFNFLRCKTS